MILSCMKRVGGLSSLVVKETKAYTDIFLPAHCPLLLYQVLVRGAYRRKQPASIAVASMHGKGVETADKPHIVPDNASLSISQCIPRHASQPLFNFKGDFSPSRRSIDAAHESKATSTLMIESFHCF